MSTDAMITLPVSTSGVNSVTASPPLFSGGGTDPNITIQQATSSQPGYLSAADWSAFNSKEKAFTRTPTAISYTTVDTDFIVAVTNTGSARTITLGSAVTFGEANLLIVKDESGGAATHNITVARSLAETIDGQTSITISANYGVVRLYSNGANWFTW